MPTSTRTGSRRLRRIGSATLVGAAGAGALLGFSGTASATVPTEQTIDGAQTPVTAGTPLTFTGRLTGLGDSPVAEQQVDLEWRGGPDQPWAVSNAGTTDADGVAAIPATVRQSAEWRISYHGDRVNDPSASPIVGVQSEQPEPPAGQRIVDAAASQAGKAYSYGASGPDSYDCSGLTQFAHREAGVELPRTSGEQRAAVPEIARAEMAPGDLVFFHDGGSVYHTGVFAGDNKIWAAPESGDVVRLQEIWTDSYTVGRAW
ncbi:C40 family peptidase [Amycolatopsis antarctica]|uniref:C40 family peptidase n=1 Tax=Amycolatopsis antarctica TaxID=1854586 RepID=UPI0026D3652E